MSKGVQLTVGATLVAGLLAWYGVTNLGASSSFVYYKTVEEFMAAADVEGRSLRVHGYVSNDSIDRDLAARRVHFQVQSTPPHAGGAVGSTLAVVYGNLDTPDLFRDGAEVVVEGTLEGRGNQAVFVADNVLAKCPSKFEAKAAEERTASNSL